MVSGSGLLCLNPKPLNPSLGAFVVFGLRAFVVQGILFFDKARTWGRGRGLLVC